ncbi:MAG: inositol monophosphatase [Rhodospirillales bacterium]|nr:inositol monophosphatase [Rhodospirillales bacterium]
MLELLGQVVRNLGAELLAMRDSGGAEGTWEGSQFKAEADRIAHDYLVDRLGELDPGTPIISEEDLASHAAGRPERYLLIDPIDGTASYAGGFDGYVTQVAVMSRGRPVQAAIYAPALDRLYLAEAAGGATLNGTPLKIVADPKRRILIDNYATPRGTAARAFESLGCTGYVESGSISLKICRVADGTADIFFKDVVVRDWDVGAPDLILSEAGGTLIGLDGRAFEYDGEYDKPGMVAAGNAQLAKEVVLWLEK